MSQTKIEWADHSKNPVRVKGGRVWKHGYHCTKVSPGCAHCYAERLNIMRGTGQPFDDRKVEFYLDLSVFDELPQKACRVFIQSMGDIFHPAIPKAFHDQMFMVMTKYLSQHTYIILTKRPELIPADRWQPYWNNLWLGITAENQDCLDERWKYLKQIPAAVVFISHEPALGSLILPPDFLKRGKRAWLIAGGESGPKARPAHPDWIRQDQYQCQAAGVPFFFKQWGEWFPLHMDMDLKHVEWFDSNKAHLINMTKDGTVGNEVSIPSTKADWPGEVMGRVGKKKAGRLLDDREWNEYPCL